MTINIEKVEQEGLEPWQRGMLLQDILSDANASSDEYFAFLKNDMRESTVFSVFNLKRFLQYKEDTINLEINMYYWVKREINSEWEIGFFDDTGVFETIFVNGYLAGDFFQIDLTPIVRGDDNESL